MTLVNSYFLDGWFNHQVVLLVVVDSLLPNLITRHSRRILRKLGFCAVAQQPDTLEILVMVGGCVCVCVCVLR